MLYFPFFVAFLCPMLQICSFFEKKGLHIKTVLAVLYFWDVLLEQSVSDFATAFQKDKGQALFNI